MNKKGERNFLDRTLLYSKKRVSNAWQGMAGTARAIKGKIDPNLPKPDRERLAKQMQTCLDAKGGEVTARRNTAALGRVYLGLNDKGKKHFLTLLSKQFDIDRAVLIKILASVCEKKKPEETFQVEEELRKALVSPRIKILKQFTALPEGVKFLVDMRADILKYRTRDDSALIMLERDLRQVLASWFDVGLLDMQQITWESPAALLEKLIAYEAVHEIRSWDDLRNRLDSDRRCFAFFHPKMPDEPLIFVEVALVNGLANNIQVLLDESLPDVQPEEADTAIFYSISNAQAGLAGISFGNFLIKRVVESLSSEFKKIKTFATLSPIPGFNKWLKQSLEDGDESLFTATEAKLLCRLTKENNAAKALNNLLGDKWYKDITLCNTLRPIVTRLCSHYLLKEKRGEKALDPVANFHLTNGARLEQINWMADSSAKGLKQSLGLMVNYLYNGAKIDDNHEIYVTGKAIPASKTVKSLLK